MIRHGSFLIAVIMGTAMIVSSLSAPSHAREQDVIVVLTGKLTGHGQNSVVVDGKKVEFCEKARILDPAEMEIRTEGLIATEQVQVTIKNGCATQVKALEIRR